VNWPPQRDSKADVPSFSPSSERKGQSFVRDYRAVFNWVSKVIRQLRLRLVLVLRHSIENRSNAPSVLTYYRNCGSNKIYHSI